MRRAESLLLAALTLAAVPTPARACTVSSAGVAFGAYNPRSTGAGNGTGTISVSCHPSVSAPVVTLSTGGSGSYATRRMTSGAWLLNYNLYTNSARTIIWGDGSGGSVSQTLSGGSVSGGQRRFSRTIYGRIPALQNVGAGSYGDTIIMTVTF